MVLTQFIRSRAKKLFSFTIILFVCTKYGIISKTRVLCRILKYLSRAYLRSFVFLFVLQKRFILGKNEENVGKLQRIVTDYATAAVSVDGLFAKTKEINADEIFSNRPVVNVR